MSVYKHVYRAYTGKVTPDYARVLVLTRYAFAEAWASKISIVLFVAGLIPLLVTLFGIYLANNPMARMLIGGKGPDVLSIDAAFFLHALIAQSWVALILTSWIAPRLITFDLADNALPILLSHPISRFGYVFGKYIAMFGILSVITWIPMLLLFAYQGYSAAERWTGGHLQIAVGLFVGSLIWIAFLSIVGLAFSAWVKWRVVASGIIFAVVLVPAGIGAIVTGVLGTKWGFLLNIPFMMATLWQRLLGVPGDVVPGVYLSTLTIFFMLTLISAGCIAMLNARIRAREVVRG